MPENTNSSLTIGIILFLMFFGLTAKTTVFFFPVFGAEVYELITFYTFAIVLGLLGVLVTKKQLPDVKWYSVLIRFVIAYPVFYLLIFALLGGNLTDVTVPAWSEISRETIISVLENYLVYIILGTLMVSTVHGFTRFMGMTVPTLKRTLSHVKPVAFITLLHVGSYSQRISTFNDLYIALLINFSLFMVMYVIFDIAGFGIAEGLHAGWNTNIAIRGLTI